MKKLFVAFSLLTAISFSSSAAEIEAVYHFPAGSGLDNISTPLWKAVESTSDTKVKKVFYKSCAEAFEHLRNNPNSILVGDSGSIDLDGSTSRCPDAPKNNIQLVSQVISLSAYFCTAPDKPQLTLEDFKSKKAYKVGAVAHPSASGAANAFIKHFDNKSRVIPYTSAAELRTGALSGDVDYVFGINGILELTKSGSKCLSASSRYNAADLPTMAKVTNSDYPEYMLTTALFTSHPNPEINKIIQRAMQTLEFKNSIKERSGVHLGLGSSTPLNEQVKLFKNDFKTVNNFKQ